MVKNMTAWLENLLLSTGLSGEERLNIVRIGEAIDGSTGTVSFPSEEALWEWVEGLAGQFGTEPRKLTEALVAGEECVLFLITDTADENGHNGEWTLRRVDPR